MRPLPKCKNIYAGLDRQITVRSRKDGGPIRNPENAKRPAGMSGRQWKRTQREARKVQRGARVMAQAKEKQLAGFFSMGQSTK